MAWLSRGSFQHSHRPRPRKRQVIGPAPSAKPFASPGHASKRGRGPLWSGKFGRLPGSRHVDRLKAVPKSNKVDPVRKQPAIASSTIHSSTTSLRLTVSRRLWRPLMGLAKRLPVGAAHNRSLPGWSQARWDGLAEIVDGEITRASPGA